MSKYPHEAFTIQGGCLCSAIRYTLSYPSQPNRPIVLPSSKSNGQGDIRLPQSAVCFCNDCRRSSSGLVLFAIMAPFHQTSFSLLHKRSASDSSPASDPLPGSSSVSCSKGRMEFVANEHFPPKVQLSIGHTSNFQDTYLTTYQSSEKALRAFCSRCGTPFSYIYTKPLPPGATSGGMDFYLGTVDRSDLEEKIGGLDRFVHTDLGIGWVKKLFVREEEEKEKGKVPWHPGTNMADFE